MRARPWVAQWRSNDHGFNVREGRRFSTKERAEAHADRMREYGYWDVFVLFAPVHPIEPTPGGDPMTDETIGTVEAHEVILERCPTGCGHWKRATLPMKWEQDVEHGFAIPIVGCGNPWHYTNLAAAPMTDETTRLRDALLDARYELSGVLYPYTSTMPDDVHLKYAKALDALIKAAAAEARAGLVGVEAVREAAHWLERSQREQNVHQFRHGMALLRAALAGPTPSPAVERVVGAVFCPCLPSGGWVCEECGAPVESEPCPDHMDPEGVMTYRPGVPCPDRRTPTPEPTDG